jgi:hypothetical protein
VDCSASDLMNALYEVSSATFFATMPLWFLPTIGRFFFAGPTSLSDALKTGELFIYSAALSGPLVYIITKRYGEFSPWKKPGGPSFPLTISFPYGGLFVTFSAVMCIVSGFAFAILQNPVFETEADLARFNPSGIISLSTWCFWLSTAVLYCVTAYKNMLEQAGRAAAGEEDKFVDAWLEQKQ